MRGHHLSCADAKAWKDSGLLLHACCMVQTYFKCFYFLICDFICTTMKCNRREKEQQRKL